MQVICDVIFILASLARSNKVSHKVQFKAIVKLNVSKDLHAPAILLPTIAINFRFLSVFSSYRFRFPFIEFFSVHQNGKSQYHVYLVLSQRTQNHNCK